MKCWGHHSKESYKLKILDKRLRTVNGGVCAGCCAACDGAATQRQNLQAKIKMVKAIGTQKLPAGVRYCQHVIPPNITNNADC